MNPNVCGHFAELLLPVPDRWLKPVQQEDELPWLIADLAHWGLKDA